MKERALLIGVRRPGMTGSQMEASLAELGRLVDTADGLVAAVYKQELKTITPATFIGKGKVDEIKGRVSENEIDVVVFDDELSPAQNRNLSDAFGMKVVDRTAVILDIFAKRAHSREGKLQVELAQLAYRLPRLTGRGLSLSQQAGYIGNRGPGETRLEVDRRKVRGRISRLKEELKHVRAHRRLYRLKRMGVPIPVVALIGYTNAGKSTLMNAMTSASVFVEDKLFATLDPTTRKMRLKNGREILVTDTVGFIRRLPHQLVLSFKATFEEVENADLLVHMIDASDPEMARHAEVVASVISEMGLSTRPCIKVYNKSDRPRLYARNSSDGILISALRKTGLAELSGMIDRELSHNFKRGTFRLPHTAGSILSEMYRIGRVVKTRHNSQGVRVTADLPEKLWGKYRKYSV